MTEELPVIQLNNEELDRSYNFFSYKMTQKEKNKQREKKVAANQKKAKSGGKGPLEFLRTTNYWLENVPIRIIDAFDNFIGTGENIAQHKVDTICAWLAWKVNIAIERKRQAVLRILYEQYESTMAGPVMKVAKAIKKLVSDPLGAIGSFASAIFGPVVAVFKWIAELVKEVLKLAENLSKVMSALPPEPPVINITYSQFQLKVRSISLGEIISGPEGLPPPEVIFPEPEKPFTKESFAKDFETASASLKSAKTVYKLNEDDKKALEAMNKDNIDIKTAFSEARDSVNFLIS